MRRWYEPRRDRPDLERSAIRKRGFVGYMDMLWREFFELLKLNLLFVLSCVPIITIPAALTAMHRITSVMVRDENHFLWPDYWKAFRRDFWKSLGGGAAIAAVMALFSLPLNYFVTYPMYVNVYGLPMDAILGMYNAILPGTDSLLKALVIFNLPFTFFKGMLDVALTFLVYKPLSPVLHGRR